MKRHRFLKKNDDDLDPLGAVADGHDTGDLGPVGAVDGEWMGFPFSVALTLPPLALLVLAPERA